MAAAMIDRAGGSWPPDEREQYEYTLDLVRSGLPEEQVERARARGAAMTTDEGVSFAIEPPQD